MKKFIFSALFLSLLIFQNSKAESGSFGFFGGLSTPSNKINDVYNSKTVRVNDTAIGNLISQGLDNGYYIGIKYGFKLNKNFTFFASAAYNSFPESEIKVVDPNDPSKTLTTLSTSTKIVPISAGLQLYPFHSIISPYIAGNLTYSYIYSTVNQKVMGVDVAVSTSPSDSRFGAGIGVGIDFDLKVIGLNLEGKYNYVNLIGKTDNEQSKSYFTLGIGVIF
ncbi:MAG TPA: outer membrane beta-barrel protein [Candidatus Kapabacteria bacterium]|jgi:outer membrane protein W|nr:outer membrane beta-barrel protein [Candidatus Kapabacteria bacterium]